MAVKLEQPRVAVFYGMKCEPHRAKDGTWLEAEEWCYPSGKMLRRAWAKCEDGLVRIIQCGIPDTYFSIPGFWTERVKDARGYSLKRVHGFVSCDDEGGYKFTAYKTQPEHPLDPVKDQE